MMILIKFVFIYSALRLHDAVLKPMPPTIFFLIPITIISMFSTDNYLLTLVSLLIYLAIVYGYFWLLTRFDTGLNHWSILIAGVVGIVGFL